jgi:hypothetical protein
VFSAAQRINLRLPGLGAGGRIAGALSLLLWMLVIFYGRWVGFTT